MRSNREGLTGAVRAWFSRQPLVISFRNWRSGKTGHFPKSRITTRKHHRVQMLRSFSLVFLLICATLAFITISQPTRPKYTSASENKSSSASSTSSEQLFPQPEVRCHERKEMVQIGCDTAPSLLFFVESGNIEKFKNRLLGIEESLLSVIEQQKLMLYVIYLDDEIDTINWARLKQVSGLAPGSVAVWLTKESRDSFLEQVPVADSPSWMLIDENQKIQRMTSSARLRYADVADLISS